MKNKKEEFSDIFKEDNSLARILDVVAWILLVSVIILGIILANNEIEFSFTTMFSIWISYGSVVVLLFVSSEIITILHDIRRKLYNK